jgi:hypothetical protein
MAAGAHPTLRKLGGFAVIREAIRQEGMVAIGAAKRAAKTKARKTK